MAYVFRKISFFTVNGLLAHAKISTKRKVEAFISFQMI